MHHYVILGVPREVLKHHDHSFFTLIMLIDYTALISFCVFKLSLLIYLISFGLFSYFR